MKRHKGIKKLQPGKYLVRVRVRDARTGIRKEAKRVVDGTLEHALSVQKQIAEELIDDRRRQRVKLAEYATTWLEHRRTTIKPSTAAKYYNDLTHHIVPALGSLYVDSIRPQDVKAFVAAQTRKNSGWTVANRLRLLRTIAKDALADGLAEVDFCARVRLPRCQGYTEDQPNCLSATQLDAVARHIPARWYPLFATVAFTGLRWGEVTGLKWSDIDYERGLIHVRRNNWKGTITTPKTRGSKRIIPMVETLAEILLGHRVQMQADGHPGLDNGWIFPNQRGTLHTGTPLGPVLRKAAAHAGVPFHVTVHGLRRTFNDLARRVATAHVVRAIVGHTTSTMTEHYSVVDAGEKQAVQAAVLRMLDRGDDGEGAPDVDAAGGPKGEDPGEGGPIGDPVDPLNPQ